MSTINFYHLRLLGIFVTVVQSGSFAAAARILKSSRSRISEQVGRLEADLGVRLLQRSTRCLNITREGLQVYEQASQLQEILHGVESVITPSEPSGRVSVTMNHDVAYKFILPVLKKLRGKYPKIQLDLSLENATVDLIREQVDFGICIGVPKDKSLIARAMHEESGFVFASPEYLGQTGVPKAIEELERLHWIIPKEDFSGNVMRIFEKDVSVDICLDDYYRCDSQIMIQKMVEEGLGVALLLPSMVKHEVAQGRLIRLMPQIRSEVLMFSLVYPSRRHVPLRTRVVIDYLLEAKIFS